jgi:hypothetical protein
MPDEYKRRQGKRRKKQIHKTPQGSEKIPRKKKQLITSSHWWRGAKRNGRGLGGMKHEVGRGEGEKGRATRLNGGRW